MRTVLAVLGLLTLGGVAYAVDDSAQRPSATQPVAAPVTEPVMVSPALMHERATASRMQGVMNTLLKRRDDLNAHITSLQKEIDAEGATIKSMEAPPAK